ncbi:MAG TPA: tetratricopeptide repeat protein [Acidobacteriota bacterium]|nr:tetratricopeptide repeat protein [Acidobacteriota bacterium]
MKLLSKSTALLAVVLLASGWMLAAEKTIQYSTDSQQAIELVEEITHGIENFQPGPTLAAKAQELLQAAPDWGFAHMVASQFQPNPQAQEMLAKADELSESMTEGEKLYLKGAKFIRGQSAPDALKAFQEMARLYPDERRAHMLVGQLAMGTDPDTACRAFDRAYELNHDTPRIFFFKGNCQMVDGRYDKARKTYAKGMAKADGFAFGLHFGTILSRVHQGQTDQALKAVDEALEGYMASPNVQNFPPVFIHNMRARINLEDGRLEAAMADYEKGLKSLEGSGLPEQQMQTWVGRYHHGRGRTLAKMGRHEEAWAEAEWVREAMDEGGSAAAQFEPAYHYLAGYLKLEAGDYKAAIDHLEQAANNDPFHQTLLARAYHKDGQNEKAREAYQRAAAITTVNLERALSHEEAVRMAETLSTTD